MARLSPLVLAPPLLFAGLAALFWFGMNREDPDALPSARAGQPAPAVELVPLGDRPLLTDAVLEQGGPKLVNFWASWCAPCRAEHPLLMELAEQGVPIHGVNYKDEPEKALGFLAELGTPYVTNGADPSGRTGIEWGLYGVPETYVIDADGTVVLRFAGPLTEKVVEERIRPALAEAGSPAVN